MKHVIYKYLLVAVLSLVVLTSVDADEQYKSQLDASIVKATEKVALKLATFNSNEIKNIAVLPLWGETEQSVYATDSLKSFVVNNGGFKVMTRSESELNQLLGEIKWNTLREDIMDVSTIQRFGKYKGCDAVLYGTIRHCSVDENTFSASTEMTIHLSDVETGEIVWSSTPMIGSVKLGGNDIISLAKNNMLVKMVLGTICLVIVIIVIKQVVTKATRPR